MFPGREWYGNHHLENHPIKALFRSRFGIKQRAVTSYLSTHHSADVNKLTVDNVTTNLSRPKVIDVDTIKINTLIVKEIQSNGDVIEYKIEGSDLSNAATKVGRGPPEKLEQDRKELRSAGSSGSAGSSRRTR